MIRRFNRDARLERERRRAVTAGELRDVTHEARQHGFAETVYISNRLWNSLICPYPFAERNDCLSLSKLLCSLKQRLGGQPVNAGMFLVLTPDLPDWFHSPCYLRFQINSAKGCPKSIVVRPLSEQFQRCPEHREHSFPATLLVRLAEMLRNLSFVCRASEQAIVASMQATAARLTEKNPFQQDIVHYVASVPIETARRFPLEQYRAALLLKLDELIAVLRSCADATTIPRVETLRAQHQAMVSPLADFASIVEDLLCLAARVYIPNAPSHLQPFPPLLRLFVEANARLEKRETTVATQTVSIMQQQKRRLAELLPPGELPWLESIDRGCENLFEGSPSRTIGVSLLHDPDFFWH